MVKAAYTFLGCLLISTSSFAAPTMLECQSSNNFESNLSELEKVAEEVDDCPAPTSLQLKNLCVSIYQKQEAYEPEKGLSFSYQEELWKMSCATPGSDTMETAKPKIQKMWNKNRESIRCYSYPTSIATEKNITKFSLDTGFTVFLSEAVRKYKLDMNFLDPADNKTILDFIKEREAYIRSTPPVDTPKADEYKRIYNLLSTNGAKHAKDL